ncbi:hypothetical protein AB0K74_37515 [Streptomyces sp. NPDC056159]|uniref:hypothetical protein n=1 Tax=Streptomyces sp. NPDC056159 TaxID=3155537 RepID=UPI0034300A0A
MDLRGWPAGTDTEFDDPLGRPRLRAVATVLLGLPLRQLSEGGSPLGEEAVGPSPLIFTTVNVARFATSWGVPLLIAVLHDPMIGTALASVMYVDARLTSWGIGTGEPPAFNVPSGVAGVTATSALVPPL